MRIADGAWLLPGFAAGLTDALLADVATIALAAPFRRYRTRRGQPLSAEMTAAGPLGWISDARGYRYVAHDPDTGVPWPPISDRFLDLAGRAAAAAEFSGFVPDSCLVNRYAAGARMGLHQDRDEVDFGQPIVSVSLGLPATFLWAGDSRAGRAIRVPLRHGDVVAWGGPARLAFHGVAPIPDGHHVVAGAFRYNLTFRRAGAS